LRVISIFFFKNRKFRKISLYYKNKNIFFNLVLKKNWSQKILLIFSINSINFSKNGHSDARHFLRQSGFSLFPEATFLTTTTWIYVEILTQILLVLRIDHLGWGCRWIPLPWQLREWHIRRETEASKSPKNVINGI
jgi:hypothetical protein